MFNPKQNHGQTEGQNEAPSSGDYTFNDAFADADASTNTAEASPQNKGSAVEPPFPPPLHEQEQTEQATLAAIFADVRTQSQHGHLVTPRHWEEQGLIPQHCRFEDWEMMVYDYIEQEQRNAPSTNTPSAPSPTYRSAEQAVGVPKIILATDSEGESKGRMHKTESQAEGNANAVKGLSQNPPDTSTNAENDRGGFDEADSSPENEDEIFPGYELLEIEGQWTLVPTEETAAENDCSCGDIRILTGHSRYYLFSNAYMTEAYARWAFLADEDDPVAAFVNCVREESRVYPRPMPATSMENEPFSLGADAVETLWHEISEAGLYPDLAKATASNGEAYFYSTDHLSPAYAQSLAEWDAVERHWCL